MVSDAPHEEESSPQNSPVRELARLWVQSQSVISAYITANVLDVQHAEDLVQEVAQVVAEKFDTFDRSRSFISWSLGIARNRVLKYYRSAPRQTGIKRNRVHQVGTSFGKRRTGSGRSARGPKSLLGKNSRPSPAGVGNAL